MNVIIYFEHQIYNNNNNCRQHKTLQQQTKRKKETINTDGKRKGEEK